METITTAASTVANTVTKTIWGDNNTSKEEPVSGQLGDTTKGEPFDAGNMGGEWQRNKHLPRRLLTHAYSLIQSHSPRNPPTKFRAFEARMPLYEDTRSQKTGRD